MRPESPRMVSLRRTRPLARRAFARLLRSGDLLHAPSAVLEVVGVDNGAGPRGFTTLLYVVNEVGGKTLTHELPLNPQREVLRYRAGEPPPEPPARDTLW